MSVYVAGMMGAVFGASVFLAVATWTKMPVSNTHAIVVSDCTQRCQQAHTRHSHDCDIPGRRGRRDYRREWLALPELDIQWSGRHCCFMGDFAFAQWNHRSNNVLLDGHSDSGRR